MIIMFWTGLLFQWRLFAHTVNMTHILACIAIGSWSAANRNKCASCHTSSFSRENGAVQDWKCVVIKQVRLAVNKEATHAHANWELSVLLLITMVSIRSFLLKIYANTYYSILLQIKYILILYIFLQVFYKYSS